MIKASPSIYLFLSFSKKARETSKVLLTIFKEKLIWLSSFSMDNTALIFDEIDTTLYMYKNVISQAETSDVDKEYIETIKEEFMTIVKMFDHLIPDEQ